MTRAEPVIRLAEPGDLPAITEIYNHYVRETHITFDVESYDWRDRQAWFSRFDAAGRYPLLVLTEQGRLAGYAHALPLKDRAAYDTSVETTIYLNPDAGGRGLGTRLYSALLARLETRDIHKAYGLIALPNAGSLALHEKLGFVKVGLLHEVGRKFGRYYDVQWVERTFENRI